MDAKHILTSKTFWVNVVSLAATYGGYLPPQYAAVIVPVANLVLRLWTKQPVTL
jgi:hypothetical protein